MGKEIETQGVGNDVTAVHGFGLFGGVKAFVKRIVFAHVLIKRYTYGAVSHDDALVERTNLRVNLWLWQVRKPLAKLAKRMGELFVNVVDVVKLGLYVGNQPLQGGVLIVMQEPMMYFGVFDSSQLQNLFYQRTCFRRIVCVHLLQCRVIAC